MIANSLTFYLYSYPDIPAYYEAMYLEIFGKPDPVHIPGSVLIGVRGDKQIGMLAIYAHDKNTIYIQAGGFMPEARGLGLSLSWIEQALTVLHEEAYYIMAAVYSKNTQAIRLLLKCGFEIVGCRQALSHDALLIELCHRKEYT